jgi:hypothetical protein
MKTGGVSIALMGDETLDACASIFECHGGQRRWHQQIAADWDFPAGGWDVYYFLPVDRIEDACMAIVDAIGIVPTIFHRSR